MSKKLLFIEDLYDFYLNKYKRSTHFSSEKTGSPIVVQVHGNVRFEESYKNKDGLCPVHLQACHTNLNINNSNIDEAVMESALPSFSNRPILGYIHKVVTDENPEGQWEFYSHNCHEDENGELVYDEVPIGIIPESCNAQLVYDKEKDKTYCEVDGYIFDEYSKASEILKREGECAVSVELSVRELSYDAKQKFLNIEDFFFSGVTILGKTPQGETVKPGMMGSNIKLTDFSEKNNSLFSKYEDKMIEFQERLEKLESTCSNKDFTKGGKNQGMTIFEKLLKKYNKTIEDITFEYKDMSDDELTAKFAEMFDGEGEGSGEAGADGAGGDATEEADSETSTDNPTDDGTGEEDNTEDTTSEGDNSGADNSTSNTSASNTDDDTTKKKKQNNSANTDKLVRTYEISHDDIRNALYSLLEPYEEADNDYYWIMEVFDSYFVYQGYTNKTYGQKYTKDGDNVAFDGERYELFMEYLTESEKTALAEMRSNYVVLKEFKETAEKNEVHAQKEEIINSDKYAVITEKNENGEYTNEAFAKLVSEMDNYSLTDLETQIKVIHSDYIAEHSNFSAKTDDKEKTSVKMKQFANPAKNTKKSRYGGLFSK